MCQRTILKIYSTRNMIDNHTNYINLSQYGFWRKPPLFPMSLEMYCFQITFHQTTDEMTWTKVKHRSWSEIHYICSVSTPFLDHGTFAKLWPGAGKLFTEDSFHKHFTLVVTSWWSGCAAGSRRSRSRKKSRSRSLIMSSGSRRRSNVSLLPSPLLFYCNKPGVCYKTHCVTAAGC